MILKLFWLLEFFCFSDCPLYGQDEDVASDDDDEEEKGFHKRYSDDDDDDEDSDDNDDEKHSRMLQDITGLPGDAFEGTFFFQHPLYAFTI